MWRLWDEKTAQSTGENMEQNPEDGSRNLLEVPAEKKQLAVIRKFIRTQASRWDADPDCLEDLVQAVDEAATNIIIHGYKNQTGLIEVEIIISEENYVVKLRDQAPHFDITQRPAPDQKKSFLHSPPGGHGIPLIRQCVDEVVCSQTSGGWNELSLKKHK
jgi:anti-sigma regulatory factor (Ser/Thr protein kinase)